MNNRKTIKKIKGFARLSVLFAPVIGFFLCCNAIYCMELGEPAAVKFIGGLITMAIIPAVAFIQGLFNV